MSRIDGLAATQTFPALATAANSSSAVHRRYRALTPAIFAVVTIAVVLFVGQLRWSLARNVLWQCDEIPLLLRFTGLAGQVSNEAEAGGFTPSYYSCYRGALRSLRVPSYHFSVHTTTGFWTNLSLHLFGCNPGGGRAFQVIWSMIAIGAVAWAAWLVVGGWPATCAAAWMVALSPYATAYGAQTRGYAEALALTPLLLVALEYFRRRPDRWPRALMVFGCALLLAQTVYSMWVYWVFPALVVMVVILPRLPGDERSRGVIRIVSLTLAVGVCACMAVYTLDRWKSLSFIGSYAGVGLNQAGRLWPFLTRLVHEVLPAPVWLALLGLVGIRALWRSPQR